MIRKCDACGKDFSVLNLTQYQYKKKHGNKNYLFCCYNCWINFIKKVEREQGKNCVEIYNSEDRSDYYNIAKKIISFDPKSKYSGGNHCKDNVSASGKIIKYFMAYRGISFSRLRQFFGVKTTQAVSQKINRWREDQFTDEIIDKILQVLNVSRGYFNKIRLCVLEIENGEGNKL